MATKMTTFTVIEKGIVAFSEREPFAQPNSCYADAYDMMHAKRVDGGRIVRDRDAEEPHDVFVPDALFEQASLHFSH